MNVNEHSKKGDNGRKRGRNTRKMMRKKDKIP